MDLFVSKYINKIDKKGRVSLPSSFRNVLPKANRNEIILYKSIKSPSIEGCGAVSYTHLTLPTTVFV